MGFFTNVLSRIGLKADPSVPYMATPGTRDNTTGRAIISGKDDDVFKAYIPNFLYKPPYGYPRKENVFELKKFAKNPYVFSVIKTLNDEITSMPWKIEVKEEFQEEGQDYTDKIKEITKFFNNPNGNHQSISHILRQVITDILEIDSGVMVKVFNIDGEFKHLFSYDGATFLKNPDIYGFLGGKADFVPPLPDGFRETEPMNIYEPSRSTQQLMNRYNVLYSGRAAYFQYGWTAGSMPVPFGKREVVYFMQNPRGDSIYGTSPVMILYSVILNLIYGAEFNLDYYVNSNIPEGIIQLLGASNEQVKQFRQNFEHQFRFKDALGIKRKRFFNFPITSQEAKFTPFQISSKDMEVLEQQKWFTKVLWMAFGVNAEEMGFTEDSNRATGAAQSSVFKRKAIKPLLKLLEYHINSQIITEFFPTGSVGIDGFREVVDYGDCPVKFCFDDYDFTEDKNKHDLLEQELRMGVKTPMMAAKDLGINVEELKAEKEEEAQKQQEMMQSQQDEAPQNLEDEAQQNEESVAEEKSEPQPIDKEPTQTELLKEMDSYIDAVGENIVEALDRIRVR